jgi:hypothetical protein
VAAKNVDFYMLAVKLPDDKPARDAFG